MSTYPLKSHQVPIYVFSCLNAPTLCYFYSFVVCAPPFNNWSDTGKVTGLKDPGHTEP